MFGWLKMFSGGGMMVYVIPLVLAGLVASHVYARHTGKVSERGKQALVQLKIEKASAKLLADETAKVTAANAQKRELAEQLEITHVRAQNEVDKLLAENRRLSADNRGLRDPGRRPACRQDAVPGTTAATGGVEDGTTATDLSTSVEGLLSPEASEFLIEMAADADRAAQYAVTCHKWVMGR